jgi:hypothetical protein
MRLSRLSPYSTTGGAYVPKEVHPENRDSFLNAGRNTSTPGFSTRNRSIPADFWHAGRADLNQSGRVTLALENHRPIFGACDVKKVYRYGQSEAEMSPVDISSDCPHNPRIKPDRRFSIQKFAPDEPGLYLPAGTGVWTGT